MLDGLYIDRNAGKGDVFAADPSKWPHPDLRCVDVDRMMTLRAAFPRNCFEVTDLKTLVMDVARRNYVAGG